MLCLTIIDVIISSTIISPLVVAFWWSSWEFIHRYPEILPAWWTLYLSITVLLTLALLREPIYSACKKSGKCFTIIIIRLYIYLNATFGVTAWKSGWFIMEKHFNHTVAGIMLIVALLGLCSLRAIPNLLAVPYATAVDHKTKEIYFITTAYNIKSSDRVWLYFLDCIFSICVIGTLVVFVWRGTWCMLDLLLYPSKPVTSAFASTVIGYVLVLITFSLQSVMKYLARTLTGISRLLVVDIYLLFSFCGTVNVWRGIWNLLNYYFLPEMPSASFLLTHMLSFLLLVCISSANSIIVRGVYIDGEEKGDLCVEFPCYYTRLFYQARRQRKLLRECEKIRKGNKQNGEIETVAILPQDSKKPVTILPMVQNNNEINHPMV